MSTKIEHELKTIEPNRPKWKIPIEKNWTFKSIQKCKGAIMQETTNHSKWEIVEHNRSLQLNRRGLNRTQHAEPGYLGT